MIGTRRRATALSHRGSAARRHWSAVVVGLLVLASLAPGAPAAASAADISPPALVSGPDPLEPECNPTAEMDRNRDWERQPSLAVNPTNPNNLVTAWRQDVSDGIVAGWSKNGGRTWTSVIVPQKFCTSTDPSVQAYLSAADPWVSFGPDGIAYLAAVISTGASAPVGATTVNVSRDGGESWGDKPVIVDDKGVLFDRTTMIADPVDPGRAYVAWDKALDSTSPARPYFAGTGDGGKTWNSPPPTLIYSPPAENVSAINQLLVLSDGSLLAIVNEHGPPALEDRTTLKSTRWDGDKWSKPVTIADANGHQVRNGVHIPVFSTSGVAADGTIYVAWQTTEKTPTPDNPAKKTASILYSTSHDGGLNWQKEPGLVIKLAGSESNTAPTLAVGADGTVAVLFDDHRNDPNELKAVIDVWLRHSHDGGASWIEDHVAGSFERTRPASTYQGIAARGDGFAMTYELGRPLGDATPTNPSDIFFSKAAP